MPRRFPPRPVCGKVSAGLTEGDRQGIWLTGREERNMAEKLTDRGRWGWFCRIWKEAKQDMIPTRYISESKSILIVRKGFSNFHKVYCRDVYTRFSKGDRQGIWLTGKEERNMVEKLTDRGRWGWFCRIGKEAKQDMIPTRYISESKSILMVRKGFSNFHKVFCRYVYTRLCIG